MSDDLGGAESADIQSRVGTTLRGKYTLDRVLGVGGMAVVYAATHRNRARFAVKILHAHASINANIRARFVREGYAANSVEHPGVVRIVDDDVAEDGAAFVVMELLDGASVETLAKNAGGRLPLRDVLTIGFLLCDVLAAAHDKGIIHRDIKPANLFVTTDGDLKVLDFGIARVRDGAHDSGTQTGVAMGTPAFMAPEQALGKTSEVDAQTDVWAAGATLFSLLTGTTVHEGETAQLIIVRAATTPARSVATISQGLPSRVIDLVDRALVFERSARWPSAAALRDEISACHEAMFAAPVNRTSLQALIESTKEAQIDVMAPTQAAMRAPELTRAPASDKKGAAHGARVGLSVLLLSSAIGAISIYVVRRQQPSIVATAGATPTPSADPSVTPDTHESFFPCKASEMITTDASANRACGGATEPWCARDGRTIACCAPGLVATSIDGTCECPEACAQPAPGCPRADAAAGLDRAEIVATVRREVFPIVRRCIPDDAGSGEVSAYFEIDPNGGVFFARIKQSTVSNASWQRCYLDAVRSVRFPRPRCQVANVVFPIEINQDR